MTAIIALDGGTTNTRLTLIKNGVVCARTKLSVGARDKKEALTKALMTAIPEFLTQNGLSESDITAIAASGMITSDLGLYTLPHISAPAGVTELAGGAHRVMMPEITEIPFYFIPGVKTFDSAENPLSEMDIMRGEETETVAILEALGLTAGTATLILPGSHMKIVNCSDGKIMHFSTTLSGELTRAAAENTILSNSIGDVFFKELDKEALLSGYELADKLGIAAALFKLRVAGNFKGADKLTLYSMLLGIILHDDVRAVTNAASGTVAVGGSDPFRFAYLTLLEGRVPNVVSVPEKIAENAAALGAARVFESIGVQSLS